MLSVIAGLAAVVVISILVFVRNLPTPGDIAGALTEHPAAYRLSLGHMEDLTMASFAYLRLPLAVAAVAFLVGCLGTALARGRRSFVAAAAMMVIFFHAARLALVVFDPFMSSRPLANALVASPPGKLIINHHYYDFSSVFFYTNRSALLLNGRFNNLVYGSYAPTSPAVFIDDTQFEELWRQPERCYLIVDRPRLGRIRNLKAGGSSSTLELDVVVASGGKFLLTNHPLTQHGASRREPQQGG